MAELQKILSLEQFTEMKNSVDSKYKDAAKTKVSKHLSIHIVHDGDDKLSWHLGHN